MNNTQIFRPASYSSLIEIFQRPVYYENTTWRIVANLIWIGLLLLGCVGILIIGSIVDPHFLTSPHLPFIMFPLVSYGLMATVMVVIFSNGGMDLSVGSVISLVGIVAATLLQRDGNLLTATFWGLCIALLIGLVNGVFVGILRIPGFLVTLGMMPLIRGISLTISDGKSIPVDPSLSLGSIKIIGYVLLMLLAVVSVLWIQFFNLGAALLERRRFPEKSRILPNLLITERSLRGRYEL